MEIEVIRQAKPRQSVHETPNSNSGKIGFWGQVCNADSKSMTVDVIANTGIKYIGIPVVSRTWVVKQEINGKKYVAADRFLPPVNSRVFVLMPSRTISGAFVLCSGIPNGDAEYHGLYAQNDNEIKRKNNLYETITESGWNIKKFIETGNVVFESNDKNIKIQANPVADNNEELKKELHITAWGNNISITENGIQITDKNNTSIVTSSSGIVLQGKNGKLEIL